MKLHGVVKGKTIELETDPELPDGQSVLVELETTMPMPKPDPSPHRDLENGTSGDSGSDNMRQARALRETIAARLGGRLLDSGDLLREDRSR